MELKFEIQDEFNPKKKYEKEDKITLTSTQPKSDLVPNRVKTQTEVPVGFVSLGKEGCVQT